MSMPQPRRASGTKKKKKKKHFYYYFLVHFNVSQAVSFL